MKTRLKKEEDVQDQEQNPALQQKNPNKHKVGQIRIDFYTDPLCCWSWAFEKPWQQLLSQYPDRITYQYIMCGMIPDWNTYNDAMNSVSNPLQMGPVWMHASEVTQVKMKYSIWHEDPPSSSFPACIAVKTAELQSSAAANKYLFHIRRSLMEDGANIAKQNVLLSIAEQLDGQGFSFQQFKMDWEKGKGKEPFKADFQKAKVHNVGRYPTLTFQNTTGRGIVIVGYRPFEVLNQAFMRISSL